jgi:hypothetical protein
VDKTTGLGLFTREWIMLVKWLGDGLVTVLPVDPEETDVNKAALLKQVLIYPGWNEIADPVWDFCKIHMKDMVEAGKIEEISEKVKNEKGPDTYVGITMMAVASKSGKKATEVIENCFDLKLLKKWKKDGISPREDVSIALNKQIEACEKGEDRVEK